MSILHTPENRPTGKSVQLMATCLCDAFYADVAQATVEVLEHLGCDVEVPEAQTCCGQPAFNAGDWPNARKVVRHTLTAFAGDKPVVVPSGSCAAMVFHGAPLAFEKESDREAVQAMADRTWELTDYIVNGLGVTQWPGKLEANIAVHRSCHLRGSNSGEAITTLLESIEGITLTAVSEPEQCCGFGGTFAVSFPNISTKMADLKIEHLTETNPDRVAAADMGCMMHVGGRMDRQENPVPRYHIAQILREALASEVTA